MTLPSSLSLQAVVVDWAGTIVDHGSRAPVEAFREVFRRRGVEITVAEAREPMGMEKRDHIVALLSNPRIGAAWRAVYGGDASDCEIDSLYHDFLPLQSELLTHHADVIPGALEALAECRRLAMRIGSSSGYAAPLMETLVPLAEQNGVKVDAVVSASEVPKGRPAPWMILENMKRLGVYPPASVVVVDDTTVGVEAGVNAGAWSIGVIETGNALGLGVEELAELDLGERERRSSAGRAAMLAAGAHYAINSIADLPKTLAVIAERLAAGERP
ncbi:phosphonoacetaldehyde hydrolase [Botrimarina mediterranea]|uniref:phosphonoacetaldehyde hydrolase n=1 Tax=Botrimarina mediterranea TaxID=2528022 RepID=A0A518K804_9BACT|nr:phosphonoacetaldehyde hydrolase [Botrimarina mediterranea]QDV73921.1 Phosphonoacetaldehyde hydrolase [Botrimarina mediterranea]QDV78551.1 Phosphonoacetaldehyde hydrolase [Planctomycetes bacterium K2D]